MTASVVAVYRNETLELIQAMLHSVLWHTPPALLGEIILVVVRGVTILAVIPLDYSAPPHSCRLQNTSKIKFPIPFCCGVVATCQESKLPYEQNGKDYNDARHCGRCLQGYIYFSRVWTAEYKHLSFGPTKEHLCSHADPFVRVQ